MKILTLELIKQHLRIDGTDEDAVLAQYGESAEDAAFEFMERDYDSIIEQFGKVPAAIVSACLLRVGTAYKYREDITDRNLYRVPYTWENLLLPYVPADKI